MNTKLLVGIIIVTLIIILFIIYYRINISRNKLKHKTIIISSFIGILAELATIFSLIVPGLQSMIVTNNYNDSIIVEQNVGSLIAENNGSVIINNYSTSDKEAQTISDYYFETVESFPVGWADSNGGRNSYTIDEINHDSLKDNVVLNSISDSKIGHEFNFVGAKKNDGITSKFNANEIIAEENMTYIVRLYVHNNSPKGYDRIAEDVNIRFSVSDTVKVTGDDVSLDTFHSDNGYYAAAVHGYITSSNANPSTYSDGVKFVSNKPFHLEYIPNTACYYNCAIGENGYMLDDSITEDYIPIGYEKMDGRIPGCYQYDSVSRIIVKPVFH